MRKRGKETYSDRKRERQKVGKDLAWKCEEVKDIQRERERERERDKEEEEEERLTV